MFSPQLIRTFTATNMKFPFDQDSSSSSQMSTSSSTVGKPSFLGGAESSRCRMKGIEKNASRFGPNDVIDPSDPTSELRHDVQGSQARARNLI